MPYCDTPCICISFACSSVMYGDTLHTRQRRTRPGRAGTLLNRLIPDANLTLRVSRWLMWIRKSEKVAELTEGAGRVPAWQMVLPCSHHFSIFPDIILLAVSKVTPNVAKYNKRWPWYSLNTLQVLYVIHGAHFYSETYRIEPITRSVRSCCYANADNLPIAVARVHKLGLKPTGKFACIQFFSIACSPTSVAPQRLTAIFSHLCLP